jgi:hypothetical protein
MMQKLSFPVVAIALVVSVTAGCFGGGFTYMTECESSLPICDYKFSKQEWGPTENSGKKNSPQIPNPLPSREEFLTEWGEPAETITVSDDEVTFIYKTVDIWCGVVPVWGVPVPLVVPACEGFDRITFKGSKATHLHFKRMNSTYFVTIPMVAAGGEMPKTCPKPCPLKDQDSPQKTGSNDY